MAEGRSPGADFVAHFVCGDEDARAKKLAQTGANTHRFAALNRDAQPRQVEVGTDMPFLK